ncbi:MAG: cytochrome c biogenesis protein CcsA, partial [Gammaproteobacteria bacterium]
MKIINHLPDLNYYTEMGNFCLSLLLALNIYNLLFKKYFCYFEMLVTSLPLAILGSAIFKNDFSLAYVAAHSHSHLAWGYQLGALWAGHEGSWLLWLFILGLWKFFFNRGLGEKGRNTQFTISMNRLLSLVIIVFALLSKYLSNPFALQNNWIPQEGMDLNPVLQDPALIIHPPFLFLGYAGLILPWAWSVVVLIRGRFSVVWLKLIYPWILCTFSCLSIGIALGSWWAYYELGWGGFWFWDPVENASFMPWLVGTALIHSLMVAQRSAQFKA